MTLRAPPGATTPSASCSRPPSQVIDPLLRPCYASPRGSISRASTRSLRGARAMSSTGSWMTVPRLGMISTLGLRPWPTSTSSWPGIATNSLGLDSIACLAGMPRVRRRRSENEVSSDIRRWSDQLSSLRHSATDLVAVQSAQAFWMSPLLGARPPDSPGSR